MIHTVTAKRDSNYVPLPGQSITVDGILYTGDGEHTVAELVGTVVMDEDVNSHSDVH